MTNLAAAQRAKTAHEVVRRQIRDAGDPQAARQVAAAILLDPLSTPTPCASATSCAACRSWATPARLCRPRPGRARPPALT
jgi:hypothetical protein